MNFYVYWDESSRMCMYDIIERHFSVVISYLRHDGLAVKVLLFAFIIIAEGEISGHR